MDEKASGSTAISRLISYVKQALSGKADKSEIPSAVTEQTVSGWGFTKNTGTYSKPSGGIPDSDIASAATWNAKGTYSKPSGGIPASDLAAGVIPSVPQMATQAGMSDWTSGKTVDAATLKTNFIGALTLLSEKANISDIPAVVSVLTNDSGYQTAAQVQTAIAAIPAELPAVTASDNGEFLRVVNGAWAAATVPSAEFASFGGGTT